MKSITLGLALSLLGGVAMAQTPPSASVPPSPAAAPQQPAAVPAAPAPQQNAQATPPGPGTGPQPGAAPGGPPEGMIVETPNGFYLVRPGDKNPRRLDLGQGNGPAGQTAQTGQNDPSDDAAMDDTADEGLRAPPPPPGPRHAPPPRPPEGKGARFRIRTPNLTLGMKCPDDEPIKACVDAVSQLLDKANTPAH
jgi:hypothetical protein